MALPTPVFATPPEPLASSWGERECDVTDKPGVRMFRDFVDRHQGGIMGSIARPCVDRQSGHSSGRAYDWMISALDGEQKRRAEELLEWLLKNDAEMFRRVGLTYIIWNKLRWSGMSPGWVPYDGFDASGRCTKEPCRNPHVDHVHFSFSKAGANAETSFYDWLNAGEPTELPVKPPAVTTPRRASSSAAVLGFVVGFVASQMVAAAVEPKSK